MSISIDARKYLGHNYLIVREWDGYDKPSYTPVFKITEEEIDFAGGRFEKMLDTRISLKKKLIIGITKETNIEEIINWIYENANNLWYFDISTDASDCYFKDVYYGEVVWVFYFKDKKDAMGFKLRWN